MSQAHSGQPPVSDEPGHKGRNLLQHERNRWSIEVWHQIRDTQLHEDANRYRGNGAGVMATLRTSALNMLRLVGFRSIRTGLQTVTHKITPLLAVPRRQPKTNPE